VTNSGVTARCLVRLDHTQLSIIDRYWSKGNLVRYNGFGIY